MRWCKTHGVSVVVEVPSVSDCEVVDAADLIAQAIADAKRKRTGFAHFVGASPGPDDIEDAAAVVAALEGTDHA